MSQVADAAREIRTDRYSYVFGPYAEPIATVRPGEIVDIFTEDAFESRVQSVDDLPTEVLTLPFLNPQTGPIVVEGAEKGDTLAVEILEIEPTRDFVVSAHIPNFGGLTGTVGDRAARPRRCPSRSSCTRCATATSSCRAASGSPTTPFVGTIATAPELEAIARSSPGPFGGNMDVPDTCPGNTCACPSTSTAPTSSPATPTPRRATASCAASRAR